MADFKALKKLETLPPSRMAGSAGDDDRLVVLIKLRQGAQAPAYVVPRASISSSIMSAEIPAKDLQRIDADPAVESVSVSQRLPVIK